MVSVQLDVPLRGQVPFHLFVAIFTCLAAFSIVSVKADEPPNILLVIADDLGLDASRCYDVGVEKPEMPVLERMCAEGVVFENFYTAPVCSPTRATIATGRYGFRTGVGTAVSPRSSNGLPLSETTIFQLLDMYAPQEYAHAVIGKWHLANRENGDVEHPRRAGVGYYAGVIEGTVEDYYNWPRTFEGRTENVDRYITSALTDEAIDWINRQSSPWFLWLAHVAPHLPLHLPPDALHKRQGLTGSQADMRQRPLDYYLASLEALDAELGRLIAEIPPEEQDNLVVIFIGDNGAPNRVAQEPFMRGKVKGSLFEGGVHAPMIVWGAGVTRAGAREPGLVNSTDIFATIAQLAGAVAPNNVSGPEDSISFAAALKHENAVDRTFAYVEHFNDGGPRGRQRQQFGWAVRDDSWKYIRQSDGREFLFDLNADPFEANDLLEGGDLVVEASVARERLSALGAMIRGE